MSPSFKPIQSCSFGSELLPYCACRRLKTERTNGHGLRSFRHKKTPPRRGFFQLYNPGLFESVGVVEDQTSLILVSNVAVLRVGAREVATVVGATQGSAEAFQRTFLEH